MAFFELRRYKVFPGKMDGLVKIMEEEIIPFQVSKGMVVCGSYGPRMILSTSGSDLRK